MIKMVKVKFDSRSVLILIFIITILNVLLVNEIAYCESYQLFNDEQSEHYKYLPRNKPVPGGVAIIPLDLDLINPPIVFFNKKKILVIKYQEYLNKQSYGSPNWLAIVGIPIGTQPGIHKIELILNNEPTKLIEKNFLISDRKYLSEKLKLAKKFVNPSPTEQMRINKERELINNAYNYRSDSVPNLLLQLPIENAHKSSNFGLKRILNGQYKGFHTGLDLAASLGTKIYPATTGKIILTGDFFYSGKVVFIDHGQGFITNYCHLDQILVKEGELVERNTVLGTVGSTGRVTGPHLHWSVSINDARVDPELFLKYNVKSNIIK